ncbi:MAG: S9 family peptidase [Chloroflexota bacterium]|nr:S9 family peptidase [Chloroflexota bacterium]
MAQTLTPDRLVYELALAADPQIDPDGGRIIYSYSVIDRETKKANTQLWITNLDGKNRRQLTFNGSRNSGARWSPDGGQIAFVSDRIGDKQQGIFIIPADGGEARQILASHQPLSGLAWSPDGATIACTSSYDPENPDGTPPSPDDAPRVRVTRRLDYKQDTRGDGYLGDHRVQIFVVDVASGESRRLTTELVDHHAPAWSPDGSRIAVQIGRDNGMHSQLALIDVAGGAVEMVGPSTGVIGSWAWSPTGDRLMLTGEPSRTWQNDVFVYDVGPKRLRRITEDLQPFPGTGFPGLLPPPQPVWLDAATVLFTGIRSGASGLYIINLDSGAVELIHADQATLAGLSTDRANRYVVQSYSNLETTGAIHLFDRESATGRIIVAPNRGVLTESPAASWERIEIVRDPYTIEAWLLFPPGFDPSRTYPLVLDIHGGPNSFYGYNFNGVQQALAGAGYIVVFSNPRGSGSYGRRFTSQVTNDWGGEDYHDLMAVVDAALERPYVDPDRLGVYGYSYGGYMTAWIIGQTNRFKAAVCGAPVFDLESFYGTSDIGHVFGDQQWGGPPGKIDEWPANRSPSNFIQQATTPTLIPHGEADQRCPIGQGEQLYMALLKQGVETELVRYPGGSHLMMTYGPPAHREDYLRRVVAWFDDHLGNDVAERPTGSD